MRYKEHAGKGNSYHTKGLGEVKDIDIITRRVTGYFASFNNKDSDGDIFVPGAFARTIKERGPDGAKKIFHLLQHNIFKPLGKPDVLKEDAKGLYFETEIPDTTIGLDTLKLYQAGVFNEHSVGFVTISRETVDEGSDDEHTKLLEVKLFEGSVVTWGANDQTPFVGFKARYGKGLPDRMDILIKEIKSGTYSDDIFPLLEIELEQIKTQIAAEHSSKAPEHGVDLAITFREQLNIIN